MKGVRRWSARNSVFPSMAGLVVLLASFGMAQSTSASTDTTSALPAAPTAVTAVASTTAAAVTVSWQIPPGGFAPDRAEVVGFQGSQPVGSEVCAAPLCNSMRILGLQPGQTYDFKVADGVASGYSTAVTSNSVTVRSGCPTAAVCVAVDADQSGTPISHVGSGLLKGLQNSTPSSLVTPLGIKTWRVAAGLPLCNSSKCIGYNSYDQVKRADPSTSIAIMLSANWNAETYESTRECNGQAECAGESDPQPWGGAATPWSDWPAYDQFISSVVRAIETTGRSVDYWGLVNEPPAPTSQNDGYFDEKDGSAETVSDIEQWLLHTYDDVKAVDPSAQIDCPDFESYADYPGENASVGNSLDFATFLAFAAANNMSCNAFSWHEIARSAAPTDFFLQPEDIATHVSRFRALLAKYPQFANAKIFIDEYGGFVPRTGSQPFANLPGWSVGYLAALESAHVDQANRSCWQLEECADLLDGLLAYQNNTIGTAAVYWPNLFYAQMSGNLIPVSSTAEQVSGLADLNAASNTISLLLGRHEVEGTNNGGKGETVSISLDVPWWVTSVTVKSQSFLNTPGIVGEPAVSTTTLPVSKTGRVVISLTGVGSQNAYGFTLTPNF